MQPRRPQLSRQASGLPQTPSPDKNGVHPVTLSIMQLAPTNICRKNKKSPLKERGLEAFGEGSYPCSFSHVVRAGFAFRIFARCCVFISWNHLGGLPAV